MRPFFMLAIVFFVINSAFSSTPPDYISSDLAYVFDMEALPEIRIDIQADEWNRLLTMFDMHANNESSVKANFSFNKNGKTERLTNVGFRLRGNVFSRKRPEGYPGSMHDSDSPNYHHAHFRLMFDEYEKKSAFHSLKSLNLKWFNNDPSYVRDVYCYDLFRRFGAYTAPLSSYVKLVISVHGDKKPAYFGIYRMVESIDSEFIQARFKNNAKGYLWKCLYPAPLTLSGAERSMGIEKSDDKGGSTYTPSYDLKTGKGKLASHAKPVFLRFLTNLNEIGKKDFKKWADQAIDVDLLLRVYAVNIMVGMWDDYWYNQNNYYLYFDESARMRFIPYDYDNTLGVNIDDNKGLRSALEWGNGDRPLMDRLLAVPEYRELYMRHLQELMNPTNALFDFAASTNRIQRWQKMIAPFVDNDTGDDTSIEDAPANWGNCDFYRLLSGDDTGESPEANWFLTRIKAVDEEIRKK